MSAALRLGARSNVALPAIRGSAGGGLTGAPDWEALLRRLDAVDAKLAVVDRLSAQMGQVEQAVERLARAAAEGDASRRELADIKRTLEAIRRRLEC